jgi:hypothetical protein
MSNLIKTEDSVQSIRVVKGVRLAFDDKKQPSWSFKDGATFDENLRLLVVFWTMLNQEWGADNMPLQTVLPDADAMLPPIEPLNEAVPKKKWRKGLNEELVGPWCRQYLIRLIDPSSFGTFTFVNSTTGAQIAYEILIGKIEMAQMVRGQVYPLVTLSDAAFKTKWGVRRRPDFKVVDWVAFTPPELKDATPKRIEHKPAGETGLKSVPQPTMAEVMKDCVPDFDDPVSDV